VAAGAFWRPGLDREPTDEDLGVRSPSRRGENLTHASIGRPVGQPRSCRPREKEYLSGYILFRKVSPRAIAMADDRLVQELPLPCVLDDHDVDRLLEKLRAVHGEAGRPNIAPELLREVSTAEAAA
jgi:hypothetical protein